VKLYQIVFFLFVLLLASCQPGADPASGPENGSHQDSVKTVEVPTIAPIFIGQKSTAVVEPSPTPLPSATPLIEVRQRDTNTREISIYSNGLSSDWEIVQNTEVEVTQTGRPNTYEGRSALQVTPLQDFGQLIFRVKPGAKNIYLRSQVLALIFWINASPNYIDTDDIVVTVFGSNQNSYWVTDDRSAWDGPDSPFSETRLYYLGLNNAVPPQAWGEVINWLDDRQFDPDYKYVTGFYIKNDESFASTYFIDEISLLMINSGPDSSLPSNIHPTPQHIE
jgi:hypothetical protein